MSAQPNGSQLGGDLVKLNGVTRTYRRGAEDVQVLRGLDLDIPKGDFVALMGPSGSGKSTLLNLLGGIDRPNAGSIRFGDAQLEQLSDGQLAAWRSRNVGFIFQMYHLLPMLTAAKNVELPLLLTGLSAAERRKRATAALTLVGLADRLDHKPGELSGGQEQRVGIARAIVTDPGILLADEPTGDLDRKAGDAILELLQELNRRFDKTIVMVTHDPHAAARAKRTLYMEDGRVSSEHRP
jgi:putative ABC transport system ATP-binding protein